MATEFLAVGSIPDKFDRLYVAPDRDNPTVTYQVNVARLSCTCPDFARRRQGFPSSDARRVCAHLYDKLYQTKVERALDPVVQLFIGYGREMLMYRMLEDALGRLIIGFPFGPRYVRAIGVMRGRPLLATYDLKNRVWRDGETPLTRARAAEVLERIGRVYPETGA